MAPTSQSNLVDGLAVDGFGIPYRNDDDERYEVYPMNAVLGISSDETEESMKRGAPDISKWRNQTQPMKVTVDMAHDISLHQLADEVNFIDSKLEAKFDTRKPDLEALMEEFFGPGSEIYKTFEKRVPNCTHDRFARWLCTFLCCAFEGKSIEILHCQESIANMTGMLSANEYKRFWNDIANACLDCTSGPQPRLK
jgi:hypothetical protein